MAKWTIGKGMDRYLTALRNLELEAPELMGEAVYEGAAIVADEIKANIDSLPVGDPRKGMVTSEQKKGLQKGMGIAKMRDDGGFHNVKVGMDGYNGIKSKKYPKGQPNAMIIRSLENGSSFAPKHSVIAPAVNKVRKQAEQKMAEIIEKGIEKTMK